MNDDRTANVGAWYALLSQQAPGAERRPPLPPVPTFDPQGADESPAEYGLRALLYVLANDHAISVPDRALELAQYAAPIATAHADISPIAADTIARAVSQIGAALRARAALDQEYGQEGAQDAPGAPAGRDKPRHGPGAPIAPQPTPRPPQGSQAPVPVPAMDETGLGAGQIMPAAAWSAYQATRPAPQPATATRPAPAPLSRSDFEF